MATESVVEKEEFDKFWVVGIPPSVFTDDPQLSLKAEFESIFRNYSQEVQFTYIRPLARVLVTYSDEETCQRALLYLKNTEFCGNILRVHPVKPVTIGQRRLSLPTRPKQHLISPPASPPVGWEPTEEPPPVVDYNLIAALSQLRQPGEAHEILSGSTVTPSIVVSCDDESNSNGGGGGHRPRISSLPTIDVHTSRPQYS